MQQRIPDELPDGTCASIPPPDEIATRINAARDSLIDAMEKALDHAVKATEMVNDPMHRLADMMVDVNDFVSRMVDPDNSTDPRTVRLHGFAIGDRVQERVGDFYGHVVYVKRGCAPDWCHYNCRLVTVESHETMSIRTFVPSEIEHID